MFDASADLYDVIYGAIKDYASEAAAIAALLRARHPGCRTVLDVGCGTGEHARRLAEAHGLEVDGIDVNAAFVRRAGAKHPRGRFRCADMRAFALSRRYDAVVCLFRAIGSARTDEGLRVTLRNFAAHVAPEGVVLVEPWFAPAALTDGYETTHTAEAPGLRVIRRPHRACRRVSRACTSTTRCTPRRESGRFVRPTSWACSRPPG